MVTPEELAAFDLLIWLRTGLAASKPLHCTQSTISRKARRVAASFAIKTRRVEQEWITSGNTALLQLEREVHQLRRLILGQGLRLEAETWPGRSLALPIPDGWQAGSFDRIGLQRPLQLLNERIVDAWLTLNRADLQLDADSGFTSFVICSMPWQLMTDHNHPLAKENELTLNDLEQFPALAITDGKLPVLERTLKNAGLRNEPVDPCHQYSEKDWCGRTKDQLSLCYGVELVRLLDGELVALDFQLNAIAEVCLVIRKDITEHAPILQLVDTLRRRAKALQPSLHTLKMI